MRADLEIAMGRVITSYDANDDVMTNVEAFAAPLRLERTDIESLVGMRRELRVLTGAFIAKRERGLRSTSTTVLRRLGELGDELVEDYVEEFAAPESAMDDAVQFAAHLAAVLRDRAATEPGGSALAALARLEWARLRAVATPRPIRRPVEGPGAVADLTESHRAVRLDDSASFERYPCDARPLYDPGHPLDAVAPGPCALLCFHTGEAAGDQLVRLDGPAADAVEIVAASPGGITPEEVASRCPYAGPVGDLLAEVSAAGALVWA